MNPSHFITLLGFQLTFRLHLQVFIHSLKRSITTPDLVLQGSISEVGSASASVLDWGILL